MSDPYGMAKPTRLQFLRPFTTNVFNPISRRFAGWLPGFGILIYRGRTSGRLFRTPMNVFRRGNAYVLALTYGPDVQWVKNVTAAGGCELVTRGRTVRLGAPRLFSDPARRRMPAAVRVLLGLMRVTEFMELRIEPPESERSRRMR
jgi:deazaflavin-dependent oxidoreductase (nitroreductase family)